MSERGELQQHGAFAHWCPPITQLSVSAHDWMVHQ
jgi:hypothetical protein